MTRKFAAIFITIALLAIGVAAQAQTFDLYAPEDGDASYNGVTYGVGVGFLSAVNFPDMLFTEVSIFEIPILPLYGMSLNSATLFVNFEEGNTFDGYGEINIGWLDTGTTALTGDVQADDLGPASMALPKHFTLWDSNTSQSAGPMNFDVLSFVLDDLAAGRSYSTFVLSATGDSMGQISSAESGNGPKIVATAVPEPASLPALLAGMIPIFFRLRRRR
ncbi:MAG: PEP-CTERM sorting domain-containing protein [Armatimonadetes bacterium]|jgi:hypothetical protein|nr:PEP-CTERM sorting domain-containing protein [Armatimonadota bacterium]